MCMRMDSTVHDPVNGMKVEQYHRSSQNVNLDHELYRWFRQWIDGVVQYHLKDKIVEPFTNLRIAEAIQFLRYDEANQGRFRRHWDDAYHDAKGVFHFTSPWRKFVAITYLNDDYEGGDLVLDTVLDERGKPLVLRPIAGSMIIFPSDQRFPHEVTPVTKGVRRSVVAWYDLDR